MNKKGVTILEILISVSLISIVILLLLKVMLSLDNINNDKTYASSDEIRRTTIIKNIENDFLTLKLQGLTVSKTKDVVKITFKMEEATKVLEYKEKELIYDTEAYKLDSSNAKYDLCPKINYQDLDENYYLITINIPVLIDGENTTINDDIILTFMALKNDLNNYNLDFSC